MEENKYYIIYQTTNKINGKIYVGKHKTNDLNDGYLGSGKHLNNAIAKYGVENFERTILFFCESEDEMNAKEAEIVNKDFVARKDTYNLKVGGDGGWDFINDPNKSGYDSEKRSKQIGNAYKNVELRKFISEKIREYLKNETKEHKEQREKHSRQALLDGYKTGKIKPTFQGKHHTKETKEKISIAHKGKRCGNENSMANRKWWKDPNDKTKSLSIKEGDPVPEGWVRGRWITDEQKQKAGKGTRGKIGITDGKHLKFVDSEKDMPKGWYRGIPERSKETREKISISVKEYAKTQREKITPIMQEKLWPLFECFYSEGFKAVQEKFGYKFTEANLCQQFRKYFPEEYASKKKSHNKFR